MNFTDKDVVDAKRNMERSREEYARIAKKYTADRCPFKEGEQTICLGSSHRGRKMAIDRISYSDSFNDALPVWVVYGRILKANGSLSKRQGKFSERQYVYFHESLGGDIEKFNSHFTL